MHPIRMIVATLAMLVFGVVIVDTGLSGYFTTLIYRCPGEHGSVLSTVLIMAILAPIPIVMELFEGRHGSIFVLLAGFTLALILCPLVWYWTDRRLGRTTICLLVACLAWGIGVSLAVGLAGADPHCNESHFRM